jgi:DNA-binding beta-propeller fold protein YncE
MGCAWSLCAATAGAAQSHSSPAGIRPPAQSAEAAILPGGRVIAPAGEQHPTGAGPFALELSPSGKSLVTANIGPGDPSLTVIDKANSWQGSQLRLEPGGLLSTGLAFSGEHSVFVSEGSSGSVALIDLDTGERRRTIDMNQAGSEGSFAGVLVPDAPRGLLYIADPANLRIAIADTRLRRIIVSVKLDFAPSALTLSLDRRSLYVAGPAAVAIADVTDPSKAKVESVIRTGAAAEQPTGLAGIVIAGGRLYVSDPANDSIVAINLESRRVESEIAIRIPGLEQLRGILPAGLAFHEKSGWLLVAEAGINAIGVIDTKSGKVLGHIPAGWNPTCVRVNRDAVFVTNLRGNGLAPRLIRRGSVSIYPLPAADELSAYTEYVLRSCGFKARPQDPATLPDAIRHVVLIVKGRRSFDEILGDRTSAANGAVMAAPRLAHLGSSGYADGERLRLSLQQVDVTPNHHAIAKQWAFSDNFYAEDFDREFGSISKYFASHEISIRKFEAPPNSLLPDTVKASEFITEMNQQFVKTGRDLPQFLYIALPNDSITHAAPDRGYSYPESGMADNDNALGQILQYLSKSPWWKQMVVFVTESSGDGIDHVDPARTLLLCAGPWVKRDYVSHANTSFAGLLKTIFRILHVPSMNLFDAAATGLSDCFTSVPDYNSYQALGVDTRIYDPAKALR